MIESKVMESQEEWLTHVSKWRESGLSQAAYIRANGLKKSSLSRWIKRASQGAIEAADRRQKIKLLPVKIKELMPSEQLVLRGSSGWELRLPAGVGEQWLSNLLGKL